MNCPRHHSAVDQIEMVGGKRGPIVQLAVIYRKQGFSLTADSGRRFEDQGLRECRPELGRGIYRCR